MRNACPNPCTKKIPPASLFASVYFVFQADKRAHHNALERKRRDHIKDSFAHLRDSIPSLQGEKVRFKEVDLFTVWRKIRCNQPKCKT